MSETTTHVFGCVRDRVFGPDPDCPRCMRQAGARLAHTKDDDCTVSPETDCCIECGVLHGDPCPACMGLGYHRDGCPESEEA